MLLKIISKKPGFRRAGRTFSDTEPTIIDVKKEKLSEDDVRALKEEPNLVVIEGEDFSVETKTSNSKELEQASKALADAQTKLEADQTKLEQRLAELEKAQDDLKTARDVLAKEKADFAKERKEFAAEKKAGEAGNK